MIFYYWKLTVYIKNQVINDNKNFANKVYKEINKW